MDITSYLIGKKKGGGGTPNLQAKDITITENGTQNVSADTGYDGLSNVGITTNVQPNLESKSVTITENTTTTITPTSGKDGLSSVSVTTNVSGGIGEYFETAINENLNPTEYSSNPANLVKKYPSVTIGNNVTILRSGFSGFYTLPKLIGGSNVVDMSGLFSNCKATSIDLSELDASSVENMGSMFSYASSLTNINIGDLDTTSATNMSNMFSGCVSLTSLDFTNFDTSNVTNMSYMLSSCSNLTSLDLSDFNTEQVTNMNNMFYGCTSLEEIEGIEDLDTSNVTNFSGMFRNCSSLTGTLDLSDFDFSSAISGSSNNSAFAYLISGSGITNLNLGNIDMTNKISLANLLNGANNLESVTVTFTNARNLNSIQNLAYGCSSLKRLDLSTMECNPQTPAYSTGAFAGCTSLEFLDLRGIDPMANFNNRNNMFGNDTIGKVPADCLIVVKNDLARTSLRGSFNWLTNIKTVAEYEASQS